MIMLHVSNNANGDSSALRTAVVCRYKLADTFRRSDYQTFLTSNEKYELLHV